MLLSEVCVHSRAVSGGYIIMRDTAEEQMFHSGQGKSFESLRETLWPSISRVDDILCFTHTHTYFKAESVVFLGTVN